MSESKGHLVSSIHKQGDKFVAFYEGDSETFDSFDEANGWVIDREEQATETPELPASDMTVEDAKAINSNVNQPPTYPGATNDQNPEA